MIRWKNATFYTMESKEDRVTEVVTSLGKIIAIGREATKLEVEKEIDLNGAFVFPGFVDSHLHILGYGQKMTRPRSEEHTSELQSRPHLVCRLLFEKKNPT